MLLANTYLLTYLGVPKFREKVFQTAVFYALNNLFFENFPGASPQEPTWGAYSAPSCFSSHTRYARCSRFLLRKKICHKIIFSPPIQISLRGP